MARPANSARSIPGMDLLALPIPTPAVIEFLDADAVDPARGLPQEIEVQFNPETYRLNKGAQIAEIGVYGIDSPILQFVRGQNETLTLDLFFDSTEDGMDERARRSTERRGGTECVGTCRAGGAADD